VVRVEKGVWWRGSRGIALTSVLSSIAIAASATTVINIHNARKHFEKLEGSL
jgi:hypothetical protein